MVDACNLASLSFLLPIGLYDLDGVQGDIAVTVGAAGDAYAGIRKEEVRVGNRLALYDRAGPFGSPTSDSLRTSVTDSTREVLAVIMATGALPQAAMESHLELLAGLLGRYCGAQVAWRETLGPTEA